MGRNRRSKNELEHAEKMERMQLRSRTIGDVIRTLSRLVKAGGFVWISYYVYLSILSLSGKQTEAMILADIRLTAAASITAGAGGLYYGYKQKKLRQRTTARLQERIRFLEQQLDARRTTSALTNMGDTNPKDEWAHKPSTS